MLGCRRRAWSRGPALGAGLLMWTDVFGGLGYSFLSLASGSTVCGVILEAMAARGLIPLTLMTARRVRDRSSGHDRRGMITWIAVLGAAGPTRGVNLPDPSGSGARTELADGGLEALDLVALMLEEACERQIRGIEGMVQDDRYCIEILAQISAAQAALDKVALGLLDGHAHTCVIGAAADQQDERTEEMMAAVGRLLKRG